MTTVEHAPKSPVDGSARGRTTRSRAPRSAQADLPDRAGPDAVAILTAQDEGRVKELLPLRHARMAQTPFTFFRGAAAVMAADLAATPASGIEVQLCGDAHLANFGFFASPERRLVFDVNDFDETLRGPWEWDVKRLAASIEVAARDRGFTRRDRTRAVLAAIGRYREAMRRFAAMPALEVWYAVADVEGVLARVQQQLTAKGHQQVTRGMAKARTRDNLGAMSRFGTVVGGTPHIVADPPLVVPLHDLMRHRKDRRGVEEMVDGLLNGYRDTLTPDLRRLFDQYRLVDIAHKVVGVGSVGTRCWMLLFIGRDHTDPLFLQAKEAGPSVLERWLTPAPQHHAGRRVVEGQRLMQTVSDIFLGWQTTPGLDGRPRDFYLRQLRDWKASADIETFTPAAMLQYARLCGWTLARAHARSGDRIAIADYLGSSSRFDEAIDAFARAYADRTERDHSAFVAAIADGRVSTEDIGTDNAN